MVMPSTFITVFFSKYKYSEVPYSSGSKVSVHWSLCSTQQRRKLDIVNSISSKYLVRKPAKVFFNTTVMVLFRYYTAKVISHYAGS